MRGDGEPRGEARRVAERVRDLLREHASVTGDRVGPPSADRRADEATDSAPEVSVPAASVPEASVLGTSATGPVSWPDGRAPRSSDDGGTGGWTPADGPADEWPAGRTRSRWPEDEDDSRWPDDGRSRWSGQRDEYGPAGRPSAWQRLAARVSIRADPGRRGALAVGVAVLLAAVLTGVWLVSQRPQSAPVSALASVAGTSPLVGSDGATGSVPSTAATDTAGGAAGAAEVVVDVAGRVHRPGLYRLAPGSRVADALAKAGGPLTGVRLDSLNLAAKVVDGQQIIVGLPGHSAAAQPGDAGPPAAGATATAAVVSLNSATLEQLETLPGVGPVLGQKILDWRSAHGTFTSIDQLNDVSGIGDITFKEIQPLVTL